MITIRIHKIDLIAFIVMGLMILMGLNLYVYKEAYVKALDDHKATHEQQVDDALWQGREENYQSITNFLYETEIGKCIIDAKEAEKYSG